jgi:hypothetical protein
MQKPAVWLESLAPSAEFAALDANSIDLIRRKRAAAPIDDAGSDADLKRLLAKFETTLRLDTLYNEYELRPQIHAVDRHRAQRRSKTSMPSSTASLSHAARGRVARSSSRRHLHRTDRRRAPAGVTIRSRP